MPSPACRSSMLLTIVALLAATLTGARSLANPPSEIAKKVMPSVVLVTTEDDQGEALARGSGFVVAEGVIATNLHVIRSASKAFVKVVNSEIQLEVLGIVAENKEWDLVLLAVKDLKAPPLPLGDSTALQVGDDVYAVGNPHGLEGTFSAGIVSSIRRIEGDALLQITAPISPGSSGGPIVNKDAEVVGIAVASLMEGQNLNFAISSKHLTTMLEARSDPKPLPGPEDEEGEPELPEPTADGYGERFIATLRKDALDGDAEAMYGLGLNYKLGWSVPQNLKEAASWYRKAADKGHSQAMYDLAEMHFRGAGMAADIQEAVFWLRKAAESGHWQAMVNLGQRLASGDGVPRDDFEAFRWYRKATEEGGFFFKEAASALGFMLDERRGMPLEAWEQSGPARDDLIEVIRMLSNLYESDADERWLAGLTNKDVRERAQQSWTEAAKWFRVSSDLGDPESMNRLAWMYAEGRGVAWDEQKATEWFRKAAELQYPPAMYTLGCRYNEGVGVAKDDHQAALWLRKAFDRDHSSHTAFVLGLLFDEEQGSTVKDDREAAKWYRIAADLENTSAMLRLGAMYGTGRGVAKDDGEAAKWYLLAAEKGDRQAYGQLGIMYEDGRGVAKDTREAIKWYRRAVGDRAMRAHGKWDREDAKWTRRAAEIGDSHSMYYLGEMYLEGEGVVEDEIEAYAWYSTSAAFGLEKSRELRDLVAKRLTPEARLTAQARAKEHFERIEKATGR